MRLIMLAVVLLLAFNSTAQKFYKSKSETLNSVKQKGYNCIQQTDNENIYWFKRYDSYGQSMVQLTFENNYLRKVIIGQLNASETLERMRDLYKTISSSEALNFGFDKGTASNTQYYSGKALYQISNDNVNRDYLFIIIPLD